MTAADAARWHLLAAGVGFTEGPVWTDGSLYVTSLSRGQVLHVELPDVTVPPSAVSAPRVAGSTGGGPNGLVAHPDGSLWVAQNGRARSGTTVPPGIQRLDPRTGAVTDVVGGAPLCAPNDLAWGPDGRLFFTDPRGDPVADPPPAAVRALDHRTGEVTTVADGIRYPNGLAFDPLTGDLVVAESATHRLLRYHLADDGTLRPIGVLADDLPGQPDGLAYDEAGRLHVAATTADALLVLDPGGRTVARLPLPAPAMVTNVCFAGPDLRTLVVTAAKGGRVFATPWPHRGAPLHAPAADPDGRTPRPPADPSAPPEEQ